MTRRSYSDEDLIRAVSSAASWRAVLRALGLAGTSAAAIRSVRNRAVALGLDLHQLTARRRWSDDEVRAAVDASATWGEVAQRLGADGVPMHKLKSHASRLGVDTGRLTVAPTPVASTPVDVVPSLDRLPKAGSLLAAAHLQLSGFNVSWPLEPTRYDLIATRGNRSIRIQVKTGSVRVSRTWAVWLSTTSGGRRTYTAEEIDYFFIIDGDLTYYLIPVEVLAGLHAIHLSRYTGYILERIPRPL